VSDYPYIFRWKLCGRQGERCAVLARGRMNSCRIQFESDGRVMITSRNAIRKAKDTDDKVTAPEPQRSLEPVSVGAVGEP
jgi:hypothetical protein